MKRKLASVLADSRLFVVVAGMAAVLSGLALGPAIAHRDAVVDAPGTARAAPAGSLYGLDARLQLASGEWMPLSQALGRPRLVSLFYSHCPGVCPRVLQSLKRLEAVLSPAERARLGLLLVSLDPQRDSAAQLSRMEADLGVDRARWLLGRAAHDDVARIAARLGIDFRDVGSGAIDHDPVVVLVDERGMELARTRRIGELDEGFLSAVRAALRSDDAS